MKLGNIVITTSSEQKKSEKSLSKQFGQKVAKTLNQKDKQLNELKDYVVTELTKIHEERGEKVTTDLNKSTSNASMPYAFLYTYSGADSNKKDEKLPSKSRDLKTFRFWASELPNAPQALNYITESLFARGYSLTPRNPNEEDETIKNRTLSFIAKANPNGTSLIDIFKSAVRNSKAGGDGYIEKTRTKDDKRLGAVYFVDPANVIVLKDDAAAKKGVLKVKGYAKVENAQDEKTQIDADKIDASAKLKVEEIIHLKNRDNGDAYGHSDLEDNQETTKLIINVLNMNSKRFTNEITHSLWIDLGEEATVTDANVFLAQYKANYLGKNNFGKPLVTYGAIKVVRWESQEKDFDYLKFLTEFAKAHAPSLFGVALSEIDNSGATYNNAEQGHLTTILNTIYPLQEKIENLMNFVILPELEGIYNTEETEKPVLSKYVFSITRENVLSKYKDIQALALALLSAGISPNEFRAAVDSKSFPKINEPWADQFWVKVGNALVNLSEESFAGTDGETTKKFENGDEMFKIMS